MERKQARHETEESLILAQFGTSHNISHKFHNGGPSTEGASLQIAGEENWNHYKSSADANSMKRQRENSNGPASVEGLFDQASYMIKGDLINGELKHALDDQALLAHQHKKIKINSENTESNNVSSNLADKFPDFKVTEFKCNTQQTGLVLDKRNCHFPNGDIFRPPRSKQVSVPNNAVSPSPTSENTPGDLLEKTLSQYYPDQVSIAQQASSPQLVAVNGSIANKFPHESDKAHSSNSGSPSLAQVPNSQKLQPRASGNNEGGNHYDSANYIMNGYSKELQAERQQQEQQYQQLPSYSDQKLSSGQLPGMQHQNGPQRYPDDTNPQRIHPKSNQDFMEGSTKLQAPGARGYGLFDSSELQKMGQNEEPSNGQHHSSGRAQQYGIQSQTLKQNARNPDDRTGFLQPSHAEFENGMENNAQQRANLSPSTPHQGGWPDLNSSHSHQKPASDQLSQVQEQDRWRGFPTKPQSEQQIANPQVHSQILESNPAQRFQTQGGFTDSSQRSNSFKQQQQDCIPTQRHCAPTQHNTAPEWQHTNSKAPEMHQSLPHKIQEQHIAPPNEHVMQSEHLCEDPDLQEILSPGFSATPQQQQHCHLQRPLSHPQQFDDQQLKSPDYRPRSQPQPGHHQGQLNQPPRNISSQSNSPSFSYNTSTEIQQQRQRLYSPIPNSGTNNLKQFQPQRPNNQCHQPNHADFSQTSTQPQPHLPQDMLSQQGSSQIYPKAEQKLSCTQFQRGPQLPLRPTDPHGSFQRHTALRTHLLQKQERQGPPHHAQSIIDPRQSFGVIKMENKPRFDQPGVPQPKQNLQMQDSGMSGIQVKQENQQFMCEQSKRQGSILASMEQNLRQYQLSPVFEKKSLVLNASNKVKVESSGPVTVLSTNTEPSGMEVSLKKALNSTPKKEHLLQSFLDSPIKLLDTPIKNLLDTPLKTQYDIASCHCVEQISEKDEGPYYTHLGSAPSVPGIRELMEKRSGITGPAIRIEKVIYTGKEGKSTQGCPIAKWVIRRGSEEEKLLVLVRERTGHTCNTACIIVVILVWEGIQPSLADRLYQELSETLRKHGALTQRRCAHNEERTCACQGLDPEACGASFSFGCSWSMYYNGCKFARSKNPRKFKLLGDDMKEEERIEQNFQSLATLLGPLYKTLAPEAYGNQVEHEQRALDCRLGLKEGRPFSGVTACMDFCAHAHRDLHNMQGGSTVVCTLTKEDNREIGKIPDDEQLHVLPLYKASNTDEFGSEEGQQEKIKSGAIQVLSAFRRQVRMLAEPAKSCRQKKLDAKKAAANKNAMLDSANEKEKALLAKTKAAFCENPGLNTSMAGAVGALLQSGHQMHPSGTQQQQLQHENIRSPFPGSANAAGYPRFPEHHMLFPSTSKPGSMYPPQPQTPSSPFPSPLRVPNSYMNGSNRPYPGFQCNGGMPLDNYHPYYAPNPKRPVLNSEQQFGIHQRYGVNYPPVYSEAGLQVNGYNTCGMRPVSPMRPFVPYGANGASDPRFIDPLSRAPSTHEGLDYAAAANKSNQLGGYPNSYLSRSPQILPPGQDPFHMQIKTEMGVPHPLSAQIGGGCLTSDTKSGLDLPNGRLVASGIKQEPGMPQTPTTPQKPELWSDNEHNFLDPEIGGVAVAPSHGSVLIECAKRELHATTPIKNPDRNHPTRISLVFYQHKNLNEAKHGLAMWEAKMAEKAREKEEDAEKNGSEGTPSKGKKGVKREHPESSESTVEPPYKRFIKALAEGSASCTTNTWVNTAPYAFTKVTGPYSHFV